MWNSEHPLGFPYMLEQKPLIRARNAENIPLLKPETMDKYITVPLVESHLVALVISFLFFFLLFFFVPSLFTFCIPGTLETP